MYFFRFFVEHCRIDTFGVLLIALAEWQDKTMTAFSVNLFNFLLIDLINRLISCLNRVLDYITRLSDRINQSIHALIQRIIGWGPGQGLGPWAAAPTPPPLTLAAASGSSQAPGH